MVGFLFFGRWKYPHSYKLYFGWLPLIFYFSHLHKILDWNSGKRREREWKGVQVFFLYLCGLFVCSMSLLSMNPWFAYKLQRRRQTKRRFVAQWTFYCYNFGFSYLFSVHFFLYRYYIFVCLLQNYWRWMASFRDRQPKREREQEKQRNLCANTVFYHKKFLLLRLFTIVLNLVEILAQEKWLAIVCFIFDCIEIELLDVSSLPSFIYIYMH